MSDAATDISEEPRADPERKQTGRRNQPFDVALGARIRALRVAAEMSQGAFGQAIGVSFQQVQKYELGRDRVSASMLMAIADALRVSPGSFYGSIPPPPAPVLHDVGGDAGTKIVRLFQQIHDPQLRRRLMELIQALAPDADPGKPA